MVAPVPEGYHRVTPYLVVADGEGLLGFLQNAFEAEVLSRAVRPDGAIANAEVRIGDSMVMVAQAREPWKPMQDPWGNNWWIATHIEDVDEAEVQRRMAARS